MGEVIQWLLRAPRRTRVGIYIVIDATLAILAVWLAFTLRLGGYSGEFLASMPWVFPVAIVATIGSFRLCGLYRSPLRFATGALLYRVAKAGTVAALIIVVNVYALRASSVPSGALIILWGLLVALPGAARMLIRDIVRHYATGRRLPVAIYGAGTPGYQLASTLLHGGEFQAVALLDDAQEKQGQEVGGHVVHDPSYLQTLIETQGVRQVLVAIPSASRARKKQVVALLSKYPVMVRIVPSVDEIVAGRTRIDEIRPVEIEDLLGRDPVPAKESLMSRAVTGKSVMVTGAGGSIGTELCREIFRQKPQRLVMVERGEYALYSISRELQDLVESTSVHVELVPELASVNDRRRMAHMMKLYETEIVFHAAAYKHVPIVEVNTGEGVRNNVFGTLNCALAAREAEVKAFVLVSTDKAVRPTNVMGATKRFAEMILQAFAEEVASPKYSIVRFGNVLDSSGSVVPLFKQQIQKGGPITVTHPDVTRYFMTIPEAASLVIQAAAMSTGGDVFVLDMGEPVRIRDLAVRMIHLSGLQVRDQSKPNGDIEIICTGLRPGEKLHEELLISDNVEKTNHPMIMRAREDGLSLVEVSRYLEKLRRAGDEHDAETVRELLADAVAGYSPFEPADAENGPQVLGAVQTTSSPQHDNHRVTDARKLIAEHAHLRGTRSAGVRDASAVVATKSLEASSPPMSRRVDAGPRTSIEVLKEALARVAHKDR